MKRLSVLCCTIVLALTAQLSNAQTSVNTIKVFSFEEISTANFIEGISFTPDGILKTTQSGGTKSVKVENVPVVISGKEAESPSIIERLSSLQFKYAMMMGVNVESLKNIKLLDFIEDWFGTRYRYGGESKRGIDCSALTSTLLLSVYGFVVPRTARQQYKATKRIKKKDLKEGDLVFFNTTGGVSHVGLYLDNNYFLQASSSEGVTISNLDERYFAKRYIGAGRVVE